MNPHFMSQSVDWATPRGTYDTLGVAMSLFETFEPFKPWQEHSQTSQDTAFAKQNAAAQRERVYRAIADAVMGLTDAEIQSLLGLSGDSQRPRRVELANDRRIRPAGTRKTKSNRQATVWVKA